MFKINKNLWLGKLNYINIKSTHNYDTRQSASENYYRPSISTNTAKHCSDFMGPYIWSTIPLSLKLLPIHLFKKEYKAELIKKY